MSKRYDVVALGELLIDMTNANTAASIITTRRGALKVMPDVKEIDGI